MEPASRCIGCQVGDPYGRIVSVERFAMHDPRILVVPAADVSESNDPDRPRPTARSPVEKQFEREHDEQITEQVVRTQRGAAQATGRLTAWT